MIRLRLKISLVLRQLPDCWREGAVSRSCQESCCRAAQRKSLARSSRDLFCAVLHGRRTTESSVGFSDLPRFDQAERAFIKSGRPQRAATPSASALLVPTMVRVNHVWLPGADVCRARAVRAGCRGPFEMFSNFSASCRAVRAGTRKLTVLPKHTSPLQRGQSSTLPWRRQGDISEADIVEVVLKCQQCQGLEQSVKLQEAGSLFQSPRLSALLTQNGTQDEIPCRLNRCTWPSTSLIWPSTCDLLKASSLQCFEAELVAAEVQEA